MPTGFSGEVYCLIVNAFAHPQAALSAWPAERLARFQAGDDLRMTDASPQLRRCRRARARGSMKFIDAVIPGAVVAPAHESGRRHRLEEEIRLGGFSFSTAATCSSRATGYTGEGRFRNRRARPIPFSKPGTALLRERATFRPQALPASARADTLRNGKPAIRFYGHGTERRHDAN